MQLFDLPIANCACDNTLNKPHFIDDKPFDLIVSNPPYSLSWVGFISDVRFAPAEVLAPKSKADLAFVMHANEWLLGVSCLILSPGVLFRSGAEQKIRKYLVDNNFVDAVIQLPSNLFTGTPIATCILVLNKNKSDDCVLFIDATNEYKRVGKINLLDSENIKKINDCYTNRINIEYFSYLANKGRIAENNYNLSIGTYVSPEDKSEKTNIVDLNESIRILRENHIALSKALDELVKEMESN